MTDTRIDDGCVLGRLMIEHKAARRHKLGACWLCEYWRMVMGTETWNGRAHIVPLPIYEAWIGYNRGQTGKRL